MVDIIGRLNGVRSHGRGRWTALCPAHEDRSPSLSVQERDGVWLIHCFAGCSPGEIVSAIGLSLSDLFPEKLRRSNFVKPKSAHDRHLLPEEALRLLEQEAYLVLVAAQRLHRGSPLSGDDAHRLAQAVDRLIQVVSVTRKG